MVGETLMKKMIKIPLILIIAGALFYLAGMLLEIYADRTNTAPGFQPGVGPTNPNPTLEK